MHRLRKISLINNRDLKQPQSSEQCGVTQGRDDALDELANLTLTK